LPERTTDELLLAKAGDGDQAAFLELYERHRLPIFRFAYRLLGSVEVAEDVTHDCFLSLIRKPANFRSERGSLRSYLFAATRNLALKHFRNLGRETGLDEVSEEPHVSERQQPLRRLLDDELAAKVREAILSLPDFQREALVLFEYEGLSLNEISSVVGADVGAVKARLFRAREGLKSILHPYLNSNREIVTLKEA
jgi:RNA polymerase sigma-70 factor (ECF subfamily)